MSGVIQELIAIGEAAFYIYQALAGAPESYRNLHTEFLQVSEAHGDLADLHQKLNQPGAGHLHLLEDRILRACLSFRPTWQEVQGVVQKYRGVNTRERARDYARLVSFTLKDLSPYYIKLRQHRESVTHIYEQFNIEVGLDTNGIVHDTHGVAYAIQRRQSVLQRDIQTGHETTMRRLEDFGMNMQQFMKVVQEQVQNIAARPSLLTSENDTSDSRTVVDDDELEKATVIFGVPTEDAPDAKELMTNVINAVRDFVQQPRIRWALLAEESDINSLLNDCEAHLVNAGMDVADARAGRPLMQDCLRDAAIRAQMSHTVTEFVQAPENRQRVLSADPGSQEMMLAVDTVVRELVAARVSVEAAHGMRPVIEKALTEDSNESELRSCVRTVLSNHPELRDAPMSEADIPRILIKEIWSAATVQSDVSPEYMSALGSRLKTFICFTANEPFPIDSATAEDLGPDDSVSAFDRLQLKDSNEPAPKRGPPLPPRKPAGLVNYKSPYTETVVSASGRSSGGGSQRNSSAGGPISSPITTSYGSPVASPAQLKPTPTRSSDHGPSSIPPNREPSGSFGHARNASNTYHGPRASNAPGISARPQPQHSMSDPVYSHEYQSTQTLLPAQHPQLPQGLPHDPLAASFTSIPGIPQPGVPLSGMQHVAIPGPGIYQPNISAPYHPTPRMPQPNFPTSAMPQADMRIPAISVPDISLPDMQQQRSAVRRRPVGAGQQVPFASSANNLSTPQAPARPSGPGPEGTASGHISPSSPPASNPQASASDLFRSRSTSDTAPPPSYATVVRPISRPTQDTSAGQPAADNAGDDEDWMMRAIKDFQPVGAGFCKFKTGDTIQVLSAMNNDWLFGRSTVTGDEGKVPWDHVVDMEEGDDDDDLAGLDDDFDFPPVRGGLGDGKKILFVDDYNDTRSIAVQACMELILDNLEAGGYFEEASQIAQIDSAGVYVDGQSGTAGQGPNETMLEVIFKGHRRSNPRARDFEERTARQLTIDDFFEYDLLVCLDRNIYEIVHHKLESYQDAGHDVSPRITPLGWYVDGKGKRKWEDIVDPLTRRGLFKSQRSQMEKCWEKVQRCTKNWLLDETGWRSVRLSSLPDGHQNPYGYPV